jgi:hypothetical protein
VVPVEIVVTIPPHVTDGACCRVDVALPGVHSAALDLAVLIPDTGVRDSRG